ncbi:MAG: hemolysin family protein [Dehalococcoidia bacterium]|nr:hemolysin family protein [Dehalococcoidia bacterium]
MTPFVPVLIVAALILVNGLFVAAEFAIVGAPRASLERKAAEGHRGAQRVWRVLSDPRNQDRYIATAQLGITFASLGLGMYGEHHLAHWLNEHLVGWEGLPGWIAAHTLASVLAVSVLTYFHIVVGEMVPKSLALQRAERTAIAVTGPMLVIRAVFYPLVYTLNAIGNGLLRLVGINRSEGSHDQYYSAEELEFVVEESLRAGLIERGSGRVLRELFDLGALTAEDVMAPRVRVEGLREGASAEEVAEALRTHAHTRYPVYRDDLDDIRGVVHVRDLMPALVDGRGLDPSVVQAVPYIPESMPLESVVQRMRAQQVQFAVVLDEHGGTAGIITPDDVSAEILGRVAESDNPGEIFRDATGRLHVAGTARLDELEEYLRHSLTHDEVETVSGLVLALLERPPRMGDAVRYQGLRFQVAQVDGRGVARTLVTVEEPDERPA